MDWREHIASDPAVCLGQARIKGPQVMVSVILHNLAAGLTVADVDQSHPSLTADSVLATTDYTAELAHERVSAIPTHGTAWVRGEHGIAVTPPLSAPGKWLHRSPRESGQERTFRPVPQACKDMIELRCQTR